MRVRIVKVGVGAAVATAMYYLAIGAIVIFAGIIIIKLMFWPPCTTIAKNCVTDGWAIAGLAATILGVSTTILALLGAFAVAAWWTGLDKRVRDQVDTSLAGEEQIINRRVNTILDKQEEKVKSNLDRVFADLKKIENQFEALREITIDATTLLYPPWIVEKWALQLVSEFEMVDIAVRMTLKFLDYVDGYLSTDSSNYPEHENQTSAMKIPSVDPLFYWEKALRWQEIVESYQNQYPEQMKYVKEQIDKRGAKVEEWKRMHNTNIEELDEVIPKSINRNG